MSERISSLRRSKEYRDWRKGVIKRDIKCVLCGNDKNLEVDHIKPLALFPQLALRLHNGRLLCSSCHRKTDTYGVFSKFKGDSPLHPILTGDFLFKIKSLPFSIKIWDKLVGLSIKYHPKVNEWISGYKKLSEKGLTIEESVDNLFEKLRLSVFGKPPILKKSKRQLRSEKWHLINDKR